MARTDRVTVPVSSRRDDSQVRIGEFYSDCRGKQPSMQGVDSVTFQIVVNLSRATDAPNNYRIFWFNSEVSKGFLRRSENTKIPAPGHQIGVETGTVFVIITHSPRDSSPRELLR